MAELLSERLEEETDLLNCGMLSAAATALAIVANNTPDAPAETKTKATADHDFPNESTVNPRNN